jgi:hypothetical protein
MSQPPNVGSITQHFSNIRDPRIDRTKRHRLLDILVIAICCGWDTDYLLQVLAE